MFNHLKKVCCLFLLVFMMSYAYMPVPATQAANEANIEIKDTNAIGKQVSIPIVIHNAQVASGTIMIDLPEKDSKVTFKQLKLDPSFDGKLFSTQVKETSNGIKLDFSSTDTKAQKIDEQVVGCLVYDVPETVDRGYKMKISFRDVTLRNANGSTIPSTLYSGTFEKNYVLGDVLGQDKLTSASVTRIMQHVSGVNPITDPDALKAGDVDGDGRLTSEDARLILRTLVGTSKNFLTISPNQLPIAHKNIDYNVQLTAINGDGPFTWKRVSGSLPSGLSFDEKTGRIYGKPYREEQKTFKVRVTDRSGYAVEKDVTIQVIDSNVIKIDPLPPVSVLQHGKPELPQTARVTYTDQTQEDLPIKWDPVDTSVMGETTVQGIIEKVGLNVQTKVIVTNKTYIGPIDVQYLNLLNIYTVYVQVDPDVYSLKMNDLPMHYEGNNTFSVATPTLNQNQSFIITAYDRFGQLIQSKQQLIQ